MSEYKVVITEKATYTCYVEAGSEEEALEKAWEKVDAHEQDDFESDDTNEEVELRE